MSSLKRLLNPVDGGDDVPINPSLNVPYADGPDIYGNNEATNGVEYNGELPRISENLGPGFMNPASNIPIIQGPPLDIFDQINVNSIDFNQDLPSMGLADGFDYNMMAPMWDDTPNNFLPSPHAISSSLSPTDTPYGDSLTPSAAGVSSQSSALSPQTNASSQNDASPRAGEEDAIICYGMLYNVEVKMGGNMTTVDGKLKTCDSRYQRFILKEQSDHREHAFICFPDDLTFGHLRSATGKVLLSLISEPNVEFEPVGETVKLREAIEKATDIGNAIAKVNIDVYGPRSKSSKVGKSLSDAKLWLQRSDTTRDGVQYDNPHFLRIDLRGSEAETLQPLQQVASNAATRKQTREEQLRKMVEEVYKTVGNNRDLDRAEAGDRVRQQLLDHQKEALGFMLERESGHIADRYRLWREIIHDDGTVAYLHKITRKKAYTKPDEKGGGILADEMGMGKSLSILALAMRTLDQGEEWAKEQNEEHKGRKLLKFSRSTLIVVSAALLIDNWFGEIKEHLESGLRVIKYHGQSRSQELKNIDDSDIVVTTYHTLSAEYQSNKGKTSPLHQIGWYRVVLDEAHIIRRPTTTFYRACHSLKTNSRWCLTGTPIQNKLTDIGTLFSFIRADQVKEPTIFRKYIETPYEEATDDPKLVQDRLILLLEALCLRRTRDLLDLPSTRQHVRRLNFTPEEREQYKKTENILVRKIKSRVGDFESSSKFGQFQMRLQLRILCNHGTYQKAFSWQRRNLQDEREARIGSFGGNGEISCNGCQQPMPILGSNWAESMFDDDCAHTLCSECIEESTWAGSGVPPRRCPVCVRWNTAAIRASTEQDSGAPAKKPSIEDDHKHYFNNDGVSTKIKAIVRDVGKDLWTTKSIIFSCWTRTLHLLSKHLDEANIPYYQVDGDCPIHQRSERLRAFREEQEIPVLIMTTGTGAFGLNITCANRIFIAELQWNPSVENQAIARAIRLGQKNEVRVMRYVIKDTVEEEMMAQQKYKKGLAALGFPSQEDEQDWIDTDIQMSGC